MKIYKYIPSFLTFIFVLFVVVNSPAQCAMCKGTVQTSEYAKSINRGIEYMLAVPILLLSSLAYYWIKNKDKFHTKEH